MNEKHNLHMFDIINKNKSGETFFTVSSGNEYTVKITGFAPVPAVILYPALLTPEVIFGTGPKMVEFLIAAKPNDTINPQVVNNQLKITNSIDPQKKFSSDLLFSDGNEDTHIIVTKINLGSSDMLATQTRMMGYLDKRVIEALDAAKFTDLYSITLQDYDFGIAGIGTESFNCLWADTTNESFKIEAQDRIIDTVLTEFSNLFIDNKVCFKIGSDDIDYPNLDTENPIQSYHPIFVYPLGSRYLNIGLVGDIHGSARQNILAKSKARVIDYDSTTDQYFPTGSIDKTPTATRSKSQPAEPIPPTPPQPPVIPVQVCSIYVVQNGDWLEKIAKQYDMTWKELWNYDGETGLPNSKRLKSGDPNKIYVGEEIVVPGTNGSAPDVPAPRTGIGYEIYTVVSGDWLEKIAKRYDLTWKELWNYDGGTGTPNSSRMKSGDPNKIYVGEELVVPGNEQPAVVVVDGKNIELSHDILSYTMYEGGEVPPELTIEITSKNSGDTLDFNVFPQNDWISIDADNLFGSTPKFIKVKVDPANLTTGNFTGSITIECSAASNSPLTINVSFVIKGDVAVQEDSPEIGPLFNVASRNFKQILDKFGVDDEIDTIVIAGDIIDYIHNCIPVGGTDSYKTPREVWDHVMLTQTNPPPENYIAFVDHIGCYSLFIDFYKKYKKPIFIVSGNHDAYERPWGTSPRATFLWRRANEGIPADSNLTFYESILIFGETYHENPGLDNLVPSYFKWFYNVFTPFSDYCIDLPMQSLVGLGWGDDEDIMDPISIGLPGQADTNIVEGHLPRSQQAISDNQVAILERAIGFGKKVVLTSHFTFASYFESIPLSTGVSSPGTIFYRDIEGNFLTSNVNQFMMGTFEINRERIIKEHLAQARDISLILTGHMHRRGCYQFTDLNENDHSVSCTFRDFDDFNSMSSKTDPVIIVCDSGGNLPRFNRNGEFTRWGSDRAAGVKILIDSSGNVESISTVPVGPKPRYVVALDYEDIECKKAVITKFETNEFLISDEDADLIDYNFIVELRSEINQQALINSITLHCFASDNTWKRIPMEFDSRANRWIIKRGENANVFRTFFVPNNERSNFMSIRFSPIDMNDIDMSKYDFSSAWNFEFQIDDDTSGGGIFGSATHRKYLFERDRDCAEVPDFDWRKKLVKYSDTFGEP